MEKVNLGRNNLKKFGITMGIAFLVIALVVLIGHKHNPLALFFISAIFLLVAFITPNRLKLVYIAWMRLAFVLSWINTRLILFIMFYLIFAPVGIAMRLFRIDLLDRKICKNKESYWRQKEKKGFDPANYKRQF